MSVLKGSGSRVLSNLSDLSGGVKSVIWLVGVLLTDRGTENRELYT